MAWSSSVMSSLHTLRVVQMSVCGGVQTCKATCTSQSRNLHTRTSHYNATNASRGQPQNFGENCDSLPFLHPHINHTLLMRARGSKPPNDNERRSPRRVPPILPVAELLLFIDPCLVIGGFAGTPSCLLS